jgi:U3 small nucleolar RNA-associated protein MPP10
VVTEDVARKLEDIIRQRVKDRAWDSVERKIRPVEDPLEYKKKLVLDQEKSKLSLAQVYEEEYVRLAEGAEANKTKPSVGLLDKEQEETPAEVQQIKQAMHSLFRRLDSLTHLHYTPKQKSAELKIVRNLPTIAMEEVAPTAASNATLLGGSGRSSAER